MKKIIAFFGREGKGRRVAWKIGVNVLLKPTASVRFYPKAVNITFLQNILV
jgi:hypothetical protein